MDTVVTTPRHSRLDCSPGCSVEAAISLIDGKWKCVILFHLQDGTRRFNEIRRLVPGATQRTLTKSPARAGQDGVIERKIYAQVLPKVEESLSGRGRTMAPVLAALERLG